MKKRLHQYSEEELKRLYSRKDLYELTQMLLDYDYENEDSYNILNTHLDTSKYRHNITEKIATNNFQLGILKDNNKDNDDYDWINGWIKIITICNDILTWKNSYYNNKDEVEIIEVEDKEGNIEMRVEKENKQESIHKNDYNDLINIKATKEEMYLFILNTLRFTSKRKLQTLVDTYRSLYNTNKPGVKSSNKTISVYDEKDNLITTYKNRNECIESENISKQNLYKYLKDGKLHKGKRFVEDD